MLQGGGVAKSGSSTALQNGESRSNVTLHQVSTDGTRYAASGNTQNNKIHIGVYNGTALAFYIDDNNNYYSYKLTADDSENSEDLISALKAEFAKEYPDLKDVDFAESLTFSKDEYAAVIQKLKDDYNIDYTSDNA